MRTFRALLFGIMAMVPAVFFGLFLWWIMGSSKENMEMAVWLPCNVIPLLGMIVGIRYGWRTGEEYAINAEI